MSQGTGRGMNIYSLKGKTALVTGSSKGIGLAIARLMAEAGARVVMSSRNEQELGEARSALADESGAEAIALAADHAEWTATGQFADRVREAAGSIDILVNNAGTGLIRPIDRMTDEEWSRILHLNLFTPMALCREFVPAMIERRAGRVINITSLFGVIGLPNRTAYSASKGGLISFTKALAVEVAEAGITVNAIGAGPIRTPLTQDSWNDPVRRQTLADLTPMKRWGEPADVAAVALLLASEAGGYITGQTWLVDGGAAAR